jgi:hypothetical protein
MMSILVSTSITSEEEIYLWEIFKECTFGEEQEKYSIFQQILMIGELLKGKTKNSTDVIQGMINIMSTLKLSKPNQNQSMISTLEALDNEILEFKKNPFSTSNLVKIHKKKIEFLKMSISNDEFDESIFSETSKVVNERFKFSNDPNISIIEQNEQEALKIVGKYQEIIDNFDYEIESCEMEQTSLLEAKEKLEFQLKEVSRKLHENLIKNEKLKKDKKETEVQMEETKTKFKYQSLQLSQSFQKSDYDSFKKINQFINDSESFLSNEIKKRIDTLNSILYSSSKQFLEQIEKHLENQNEILTELLKNLASITTTLNGLYQKHLSSSLTIFEKNELKNLISQSDSNFKEMDRILMEAQEINNENISYRNRSDFIHLFNKNQFQLETMNNIQNTAYKCKESIQTIEENIIDQISMESSKSQVISQEEMFSIPIQNSKLETLKDSFFTGPPVKKTKSYKKKKKKFSKIEESEIEN